VNSTGTKRLGSEGWGRGAASGVGKSEGSSNSLLRPTKRRGYSGDSWVILEKTEEFRPIRMPDASSSSYRSLSCSMPGYITRGCCKANWTEAGAL